jgi:hypothetical protein
MSVEADFYSATNIFQATSTARWTWKIADLNRFMYYTVVPAQANQIVGVRRVEVLSDNDLNPVVELDVEFGSTNNTSPPGLINFFAIGIPAR